MILLIIIIFGPSKRLQILAFYTSVNYSTGIKTLPRCVFSTSTCLKPIKYGCLQKGCQNIGLEEVGPLEAELRVYPNPTTGVLHLEADLEQEIKYVLYNSLGQAIREGDFKASKTLNIRDLNQGVYILQTRSGSRNYRSQKIWLRY